MLQELECHHSFLIRIRYQIYKTTIDHYVMSMIKTATHYVTWTNVKIKMIEEYGKQNEL